MIRYCKMRSKSSSCVLSCKTYSAKALFSKAMYETCYGSLCLAMLKKFGNGIIPLSFTVHGTAHGRFG